MDGLDNRVLSTLPLWLFGVEGLIQDEHSFLWCCNSWIIEILCCWACEPVPCVHVSCYAYVPAPQTRTRLRARCIVWLVRCDLTVSNRGHWSLHTRLRTATYGHVKPTGAWHKLEVLSSRDQLTLYNQTPYCSLSGTAKSTDFEARPRDQTPYTEALVKLCTFPISNVISIKEEETTPIGINALSLLNFFSLSFHQKRMSSKTVSHGYAGGDSKKCKRAGEKLE